mmetsp:Transcript_13553/g.37134  ORF Transcript_13553/g.37134 Transcript_13553/m.37134 type:complete len:200 (-) Transcript_13553:48-647(-)
MNAVGAHARSATPHHIRSVFPLTPFAIIWPNGVVAAPTAPVATAAGMSVTLFCMYAMLPAVVAHVTATTLVPMIFFAVIPSCLHPGTKITAPPRPVSALSPPADVPTTVVNFHQPGLSGALTHLAMFDIALGTCLAAAIVRDSHSTLPRSLSLLTRCGGRRLCGKATGLPRMEYSTRAMRVCGDAWCVASARFVRRRSS